MSGETRCVDCGSSVRDHGYYRPPGREEMLRICPRHVDPVLSVIWDDFKEMMGQGKSLEAPEAGTSPEVRWYCKGLRRALLAHGWDPTWNGKKWVLEPVTHYP